MDFAAFDGQDGILGLAGRQDQCQYQERQSGQFFTGEEAGHAAAVIRVFGVLAAADFFGQRGTALKEDDQQQGADDAPVKDAHAGTDGEDIECHPGALFREIIGMPAPAP